MAGKEKSKKNGAAVLGFEAKLWLAADKLRNNMDAAEYKHVVLGLIFLKYISDTFEEHRAKLVAGRAWGKMEEARGIGEKEEGRRKKEKMGNRRWAMAMGNGHLSVLSADS